MNWSSGSKKLTGGTRKVKELKFGLIYHHGSSYWWSHSSLLWRMARDRQGNTWV